MKKDTYFAIEEYLNTFRDGMDSFPDTLDQIYLAIVGGWERVFGICLSECGIQSKPAGEALFKWGKEGHNWKKLHMNEEEEKWETTYAMRMFAGELEYCSDRMSLDRLFRCHWLYNTLIKKYADEKLAEKISAFIIEEAIKEAASSISGFQIIYDFEKIQKHFGIWLSENMKNLILWKLATREEVLDIVLDEVGFDIVFGTDYIPGYAEDEE